MFYASLMIGIPSFIYGANKAYKINYQLHQKQREFDFNYTIGRLGALLQTAHNKYLAPTDFTEEFGVHNTRILMNCLVSGDHLGASTTEIANIVQTLRFSNFQQYLSSNINFKLITTSILFDFIASNLDRIHKTFIDACIKATDTATNVLSTFNAATDEIARTSIADYVISNIIGREHITELARIITCSENYVIILLRKLEMAQRVATIKMHKAAPILTKILFGFDDTNYDSVENYLKKIDTTTFCANAHIHNDEELTELTGQIINLDGEL